MKNTLLIFQTLFLFLLIDSEKSFAQVTQLNDWGNYPYRMVKLKDSLFLFESADTAHGREPWITDGTEAGTFLLKDINPGNADGIYYGSGLNEGRLNDSLWIFVANDGVHGAKLWKTNGTTDGTSLINAGPDTMNPWIVLHEPLNGKVFLSGFEYPETNTWVTDGTDSGTVVIISGDGITAGVALNNELYFFTRDGGYSRKLWISDGSAAGTTLLHDFTSYGNSQYDLVVYHDSILFTGNDVTNGGQLWKTDGTFSGTHAVASVGSGISAPVVFNDRLYFEVPDSNYIVRLWYSDGTQAGTQLFFPDDSLSNNTQLLTTTDSFLYFGTRYHDASSDSTKLTLWKSNGDLSGTEAVKTFTNHYPNLYFGYETAFNDGKLLFTVNIIDYGGTESWLWITDGTTPGTLQLAHNAYYSYAGSPTFYNFHTLCDSFYLSSTTEIDYYTDEVTLCSTAGDSLHHFDLNLNTVDDVGILLADQQFIFLNDENDNYYSYPETNALFVYEPCSENISTAATEITSSQFLNLYPNPSSDKLFISGIVTGLSGSEITIYDLWGRKVLSQKLDSDQNGIDVSSLGNGVYLLELKSGDEVWCSKFMHDDVMK